MGLDPLRGGALALARCALVALTFLPTEERAYLIVERRGPQAPQALTPQNVVGSRTTGITIESTGWTAWQKLLTQTLRLLLLCVGNRGRC